MIEEQITNNIRRYHDMFDKINEEPLQQSFSNDLNTFNNQIIRLSINKRGSFTPFNQNYSTRKKLNENRSQNYFSSTRRMRNQKKKYNNFGLICTPLFKSKDMMSPPRKKVTLEDLIKVETHGVGSKSPLKKKIEILGIKINNITMDLDQKSPKYEKKTVRLYKYSKKSNPSNKLKSFLTL